MARGHSTKDLVLSLLILLAVIVAAFIWTYSAWLEHYA